MMNLVKGLDGPFGNFMVEDSYSRVEFQMRGSPHEHMFLWLKDAPAYESDSGNSVKNCIDFIDSFITCEYDSSNPLVSVQRHKHSHTCRKGKRNKDKCRFNFPIPVMPRTMILEPLCEEEKTPELKESLMEIRKLMDHFYRKQQDVSFEDSLKKLNMTEEKYILSIRYSLKRTQVFLKRTSLEVAINCYNKSILELFEANMDIQYVLEEYGLASYILNYVSKADAGLSKLMRDAASDIKSGNISVKDKFRKIANVFLNSNLMSAQEAAYHVLSLALSKMSRQCIFINTSPIKERVLMLKPNKNLNKLQAESTDVFMKDNIWKYSERPKDLENVCLADFCSLYTKVTCEPEENEDIDEFEKKEKCFKRKKPSVIRYRRYKLAQDAVNYYREQVLLFLPWRNEVEEIEKVNAEVKYFKNLKEIESNREKYAVQADENLEMAMQAVLHEMKDGQEEEINEFENDAVCEDQRVDVLEQCGEVNDEKNRSSRYTCQKRISEDEICELMQKLNRHQRYFVLYVLHWLKTREAPLRVFLSGSAGVGKSTVIRCLFQTVTSYFDNMPGGDKEKMVVLLCAPSGKAAFLIKGVTLHTAFALPVTQFGGNMPELGQDVTNTIREKLSNLKLIVIDEVSMVGSTLFNRVDTRLRQIKGMNIPFGGISVVCVGDLNQLPPVMDSHIFRSSKVNEMSEFFDTNPLWEEFSFFELTEVMRQRNEADFIRTLNNLAVGEMTDEDVALIKSREVNEDLVPEDAIRLFSENKEVEIYNDKKIDKYEGDEWVSQAKDNVLGKVNKKTRETILQSLLKKKVSEVNGLPHSIRLKVGIRYMVTCNIDVEDGLVNGACGILKKLSFKANSTEIKHLWIDFDSEQVGNKARLSFMEQMKQEGIAEFLTPLSRTSCVLNISNKLNFQVTRQQFPITPAEAMTIHKSQGQSCEKICVDFSKMKRVTRPMLYVALSRVTSLAGLFIVGNFKSPKSNVKGDLVLAEIERLRENKLLSQVSEFEYSCGRKIAYLNICSLRKKLLDLYNDEWYQCADILIVSETLSRHVDEIQMLHNFCEVFRSNSNGKTRGLLVLGKKVDATLDFHEVHYERDGHLELFSLKMGNVTIISGYKSPRYSFNNFEAKLKNLLDLYLSTEGNINSVIVLGDFNIDIMNGKGSKFKSLLQSYNLKSELASDVSTTNLKSQIDVVFCNICPVKAGTHETYFSYHKAVYVVVLNSEEKSDVQKSLECKERRKNENWQAIQSKQKRYTTQLEIKEKCETASNLLNISTQWNGATTSEQHEFLDANEICERVAIRNLTDNEMAILMDPQGYLEDSHIDLFGEIVNHHTMFKMQSVLYVSIPENIIPVPRRLENLQILFSICPGAVVGHWICCYFQGNRNHVYDSLNTMRLERDHETYLHRLYGPEVEHVFHVVQQQENYFDCGLYAMAFAASICFGKNPEEERYVAKKFRMHAAKMFHEKQLLEFPTV